MQIRKSFGAALALLVMLGVQGCSSTNYSNTAQGKKNSNATEVSDTTLSMENIYQNNYFKSERSPYFRWLDDGSGYTILEPRTSTPEGASGDGAAGQSVHEDANEGSIEGNDIVFYKVDGTGRKVLVTFEELIPEGNSAPIAIDDYIWSNDGKWALIYTNSRKVWRSRSRGDYFLLNLEDKSLRQLGPESVLEAWAAKAANDDAEDQADEARLMFAKFSPDSSKVAYVFRNNIYYQNINEATSQQKAGLSKNVIALTKDGNDIIINGNFDWVYEEELAIRDGFRWSPDSQKIGYWQLDTSGVKDFIMINNTDSLYPTLTKFPYPKAGEMNSAVRVGVVHLDNQNTQWLALEGDNRDRYIPRINWANGNELLVQDVNRPQQLNRLWLFNLEKNEFEQVYTDGDEAFIGWYYEAEFINGGNDFLWHSEKDGWRHLYRVSKDGKTEIDLTPGDFDVISTLAFNEDKNVVYFMASPENQGQRYLYRASLDGSSKPERVTPREFDGNNRYTMSKDTSNAMHSHSDFTTPTTSRTINVADHSTIKVLTENLELKEKLSNANLPNHEFVQVSAQDGTVLDAYIMTPKNLDKNKKYPTIFYVYGEPAGSTVQDSYGGAGFLLRSLLVQEGFIVVSVDNRGTRSPKGRDWRKSIYKKIGGITVQDQADALDELASRYAFIDTARIGVYGHSGGGSSTLNMLFKHGDKFHAGVAIAPVPDIALYDTIYQERYSGNPNTDPESYFNTSSVNFVEGFVGKLLLIHGTGDDNVHYQGSERLINELVKHNKPFEFMAYPNRAHGIRAGKNTLIHRQSMLVEFFKRHLEVNK
ncbi:S9 family peptidase [Glaciecola sp. MH2013]|uniref:S9 family peptidase n=1 Tax=Glaciecola sp. MH2013 TaxID=2785524 RepID=UPI00189D525F|nr:S9 family peptidase [Glaciecola sp. MH2013]MBF7073208.1 S9 family peptidase [Glaciecola sp. MH2013]